MDNIQFRLHGRVFLCANYGWIQRVLLALAAGVLTGHPLASASCTILRASTATTVTIPNAAIIAEIVSIASVFIIPQEIKI